MLALGLEIAEAVPALIGIAKTTIAALNAATSTSAKITALIIGFEQALSALKSAVD